jgi:hypothetical protein
MTAAAIRSMCSTLSMAGQGYTLVRHIVEVVDDHPSLDGQKDNFSKSVDLL